jgi:transcriptional regulator with XRE-family HTH domain
MVAFASGSARELNRRLGERLSERRVAMGLTQAALAEAIGVQVRQIRRYENGLSDVFPARLLALATLLDVDVSYFFDPWPATAPVALAPERSRLCMDA